MKGSAVLYDARQQFYVLLVDMMRYAAQAKINNNYVLWAHSIDTLYDLIAPRLNSDKQEAFADRVEAVNEKILRFDEDPLAMSNNYGPSSYYTERASLRAELRVLYRDIITEMDKAGMLVPIMGDAEGEVNIDKVLTQGGL